jgi:hypothetical protein
LIEGEERKKKEKEGRKEGRKEEKKERKGFYVRDANKSDLTQRRTKARSA